MSIYDTGEAIKELKLNDSQRANILFIYNYKLGQIVKLSKEIRGSKHQEREEIQKKKAQLEALETELRNPRESFKNWLNL